MTRRKHARHAAAKPRHRTIKGKTVTVTLDVLFSIHQAAFIFGRDRETVTKRIASFGIKPASSRRGFPVYSAKELREKLDQFEDDGTRNPDRMPPFERLQHYKAEAEKLRVNTEQGSHCEREEVEREWARVLKLIALELDTIVDHVERDIGAAPLVLTRIEQQVDKIRERMFAGVIADDQDDDHAEVKADAAVAPPPA